MTSGLLHLVALLVGLVVMHLRICAYALSSFLLRVLAVLSCSIHVAGLWVNCLRMHIRKSRVNTGCEEI